jgi:hypothetical protein
MIDLQAATTKWMEDAGVEPSARFFHQVPAGNESALPQRLADNTHFNETGAKAVAGFFIDGLESLDIKPLVSALKKNHSSYESQVWTADLGNGSYKNPVFVRRLSDPDVCGVEGFTTWWPPVSTAHQVCPSCARTTWSTGSWLTMRYPP